MSTSSDRAFEIYKLAIEQADRISARRATANSFFLTVETGLVAFVSLLSARKPSTARPALDAFAAVVTAVAGCVMAAAWWLLLRSYRDLNAAKFKVITEIERDHLEIQIFDREWEYLKADPIAGWRGRYAELGFVERVVPAVFLLVYVALAIRAMTQ